MFSLAHPTRFLKNLVLGTVMAIYIYIRLKVDFVFHEPFLFKKHSKKKAQRIIHPPPCLKRDSFSHIPSVSCQIDLTFFIHIV